MTPLLESQFELLMNLKRGWDEHDADPVDKNVLQMAREAISFLISKELPEPSELGAVEDGRLDISWRTDELNVWCTLDTDEVRIHACRRDQETIDKDLKGDLAKRTRTLQKILVRLLCRN